MSVFFIYETFLGHKLETFENCKEVNHIMIMIIAIICIFFIIFDIWSTVKNYFQKIISLPPPLEKIHFPLFTHSPLEIQKVQKVQVAPFLPIVKIFQTDDTTWQVS